jgi:hypothetical protein
MHASLADLDQRSIVFCGLALLTLVLITGEERNPHFDFIGEHRPLRTPHRDRYNHEWTYYSWKANPADLNPLAAAELKRKGYEVHFDASYLSASRQRVIVRIYSESRFVEDPGHPYMQPVVATGWIAIFVRHSYEPNFFDRLRRWLGL